MSLHPCLLLGHIGNDVELKQTKTTGMAVVNFRLAHLSDIRVGSSMNRERRFHMAKLTNAAKRANGRDAEMRCNRNAL
jgi:single-stranded DNA-binding protein